MFIIGVIVKVLAIGWFIYTANRVGDILGETIKEFNGNISGLNDDIYVDF